MAFPLLLLMARGVVDVESTLLPPVVSVIVVSLEADGVCLSLGHRVLALHATG